MIAIKITRERIDKSRCYQGKSGTYLDALLIENKEGPDKYGNDGFIVQSVSKEERDRGVKGPIIGNWKRIGEKVAPKATQPQPSTPEAAPEEDGPPF